MVFILKNLIYSYFEKKKNLNVCQNLIVDFILIIFPSKNHFLLINHIILLKYTKCFICMLRVTFKSNLVILNLYILSICYKLVIEKPSQFLYQKFIL